ncbi:MAG: hypothetical protein HQL81_04835 [Magnetococcales bacterium]|nr:hypothetical protein [Magnetococcales bacterium]
MKKICDPNRRTVLKGLSWTMGITGLGLTPLLSSCLTREAIPDQGIRTLKGTAWLDGIPLQPGMQPKPGSTITTDVGASVTMVMGSDAFLIHEYSEVFLLPRPLAMSQVGEARVADVQPEQSATVTAVGTVLGYSLKRGRILSVFSPGLRTLQTPNATIGIRGTGTYLEYQPGRTYLCTCYGTTTIQSLQDPTARETITAQHHDAPRFIHDVGSGKEFLEKAPMLNHTDDELVMLEGLVGRRPPFDDRSGNHHSY